MLPVMIRPTIVCDMGTIINKLWWIILVLLAFASLECGSERKKSIPPELKDKIVFLCSEGICTINPDGSDRRVIVPSDSGGPFSNAQWSPDKRRIGFTGYVEGQARIMLIESDGSNRKVLHLPKQQVSGEKDSGSKRKVLRPVEQDTSKTETAPLVVTLGPYDLYFSDWSAEERYLSGALPGGLDNPGDILILDIKGNELVRVQDGLFSRFSGENKIVWARRPGSWGSAENYIVCYDFKKKKEVLLTVDSTFIYDKPIPSPDGQKIAYTFSPVCNRADLWLVDAHGSNKKRLVCGREDFPGRYLSIISFSPDCNKILFVPAQANEYTGSIYLVNVDGTELQRITSDIVNSRGGACWSPDGKLIVFTSDKDGNDELYVVNIDGTGLRRLTSNSAMDCCPDW